MARLTTDSWIDSIKKKINCLLTLLTIVYCFLFLPKLSIRKKGILLEADLNCKILINFTTNYLFVMLYVYNGASSFSSPKFSKDHLFSSRVQTVTWTNHIDTDTLSYTCYILDLSGPIMTYGRAPLWILTSQSVACVFTTWRNICKKTWLGRVYFLVVPGDHYWCNYREMCRRHWTGIIQYLILTQT